MTTPPPKKRGPGRPPLPEGARLVQRGVRLSDQHWERAKALSDDGDASDGIRLAIDAAWARRERKDAKEKR